MSELNRLTMSFRGLSDEEEEGEEKIEDLGEEEEDIDETEDEEI